MTMTDKLVLIHTISPLVEVLNGLAGELLPGVVLTHIVDEPLLQRIRQRGHLAPEDLDRLRSHVAIAQEVGADVVLLTCSAVSPYVDDVRPEAEVPVLKIDEAMIEEAVASGRRIGVVATNETTLDPTRQLLESQAAAVGKEIDTELVLVEHALEAVLSGDGDTHDRLVKEAVLDLSGRVDVVVLAQASMARVLDVIPPSDRRVAILSSPHLALQRAKELLSRAE
jgi:Asp/Glu/hydantoin racemase